MRLHSNRIPLIVKDIVQKLVERELIEVLPENVKEVELDVESVLKEYLRADRRLTEEAKDMAHSQGLGYSDHQKIKRKLASRRGFGLHDDAVGYLANQLIETFLHTNHIEEIFAEDNELRAQIAPVLKRHMASEDPLDEEVRKRIKNLKEGTQDWEIRYQQEMERLRDLTS